jgi:ribosomal protein L11 methyltransferase
MGDHVQVTFTGIQPEQQEWVIAHLAEAGYDGFEEGTLELKAFIPEFRFDKHYLKELAFKYQLTYYEHNIPERNWNDVWESAFHPVIVEDFVAVRADFHAPSTGIEHEIVITPKMSFGTGHHATTYMMIKEMRSIDFNSKKIFDFGTGTGVLAVLAEKLGASAVVAADIDEWSIANAMENFAKNKCSHITLYKTDAPPAGDTFDIILANINRNVLLDNMELMSKGLNRGGVLLLSGIIREDEQSICDAAEEKMLVLAGKVERDNWLCLKFVR